MSMVRVASFGGLVGVFLTLLACPMEPDPETIEECKIGEKVCLSNTRTNECTEEGRWEGAKTFICLNGECQVRDDTFVCM